MMLEVGDSTAVGRRISVDRMPRAAVVARSLVGVVGAALMISISVLAPPESTQYFVLFLLAGLAAELLFSVRVGSTRFSVSDTFVLAYLPIAGVVATASLAVALKVGSWLIRWALGHPGSTGFYLFFSAGHAAVATVAAGALATMLTSVGAGGGDLRRAESVIVTIAVFASAQFAFSAALTGLVAAARGVQAIRPLMMPGFGLWPLLGFAVSFPLSIALVLIGRTEAGLITSTILVLAVLWVISTIVKLTIRLRDRSRDLTVLNRIGTRLAAAIDTPDLLRILARESRRVLGWDGLVIATVQSEDSQNISLAFLTAAGEELGQRVMPRDRGLVGRAFREGRTVRWQRSRADDLDEGAGVERPWSVVVAPMFFDERVIGAIAMQSVRSDAWDQRQVELLEMMASQAAVALRNAELFRREQQARSELDEFFSVVTHEIRNPLTTIQGYADMLALGDADEEQVRGSAGVIREEVTRILRLAQDLLDASKAREGKFSVSPEEVDLVPLVSRIADRWSGTSARRIAVSSQRESVIAWADPARVAQVVENLVSNAVKYSGAQEVITAEIGTSGDGEAVIEISNTGAGIPPEKSKRLFERFYRLDEGGEVQGSGLGLYISREIVRAHGGDLTVRSTPGEKTTFTITLPPQPGRASGSSRDRIGA